MVLDLDRVRRRAIAAELRAQGACVSVVETPADAFFRLETRRYALVILGAPGDLLDATRFVAGVIARRIDVPILRLDAATPAPAGDAPMCSAAVIGDAPEEVHTAIRAVVAALAHRRA